MSDLSPSSSTRVLPLISQPVSRASSCEVIVRKTLFDFPGQDIDRFVGTLSRKAPRHTPTLSLNSPEDFEKNKTKLGLISTYRNLTRLSRKSKLKHTLIPELKYFKEIQRQKLKPETTVFTRKSSQTQLNFQEFGLGDDYAAAVSVAISNNPFLQSLNFKNNRLRERGSLRIIEALQGGSNVKELNLSENSLGSRSVQALAELLKNNMVIEKLSLERALMRKSFVNQIITAVTSNKCLTELNLARNEIATENGPALYTLLTTNISLKVLDLHWNKIGGKCAVQLFKGVGSNSSLEVLDVSWNALGRDETLETCWSLCKLFGENTSLKHLDLSGNYISYNECQILADGIKANHTILGIHMDGNDCDVSATGFLLPRSDKQKDMETHISQRMISPRTGRNFTASSKNCWLCGKWEAVTFQWNIEEVAWNRRLKHIALEHRTSLEPVFVHLDIDDYEPELLTKEDDGSYRVSRAIPVGCKFFFTYRGVAQVSSAYPITPLSEPLHRDIHFFGEFTKAITVVVMNQIQPFGQPCTLLDDFPILPRPIHWVYMPSPDDLPPILPEWSIKNSIFKQYKVDTAVSDMQELMQECLEFDWTHSRMGNLIRSEEDQVKLKELLAPAYQDLKEAFKFFSSFEKFGANKMTMGSLTDFVNELGLIDNKTLRVADVDTNIRASLLDTSTQHIAAINRTEFIEIMVRIAMDKFLKTGICSNEVDAFEKLLEDYIKPMVGKLDSNRWRKERYWNEECDNVLSGFQDLLTKLFAKNSGKNTKYGEKPWMSVEEFTQCCKELELFSKSFTQRHYALCYQLSLMTHTDILKSRRQHQMSFVEFLEALSRVVEYVDAVDPELAIREGKWGEKPLDAKLEEVLQVAAPLFRSEGKRKKTRLPASMLLPVIEFEKAAT